MWRGIHMEIKSLKNYYYANKSKLRWSLASMSVLFQVLGLFLDKIIPEASYGFPIMFTGFVSGFALLFLSSSIKEALINVLFFVGPLPIITTLSIGAVLFVSFFYSQSDVLSKIQSYISISIGSLTVVLIVTWPYIAGPLALKFSHAKLKRKSE